jgi:hypothetical protein
MAFSQLMHLPSKPQSFFVLLLTFDLPKMKIHILSTQTGNYSRPTYLTILTKPSIIKFPFFAQNKTKEFIP